VTYSVKLDLVKSFCGHDLMAG